MVTVLVLGLGVVKIKKIFLKNRHVQKKDLYQQLLGKFDVTRSIFVGAAHAVHEFKKHPKKKWWPNVTMLGDKFR
jgi:hypothetical protein